MKLAICSCGKEFHSQPGESVEMVRHWWHGHTLKETNRIALRIVETHVRGHDWTLELLERRLEPVDIGDVTWVPPEGTNLGNL